MNDVLRSYAERATHARRRRSRSRPGAVPPRLDADASRADRAHLLQADVRQPAVRGRFAPSGESTPIRTIMAAIAQARDFIYIEDQYFTPPDDYVQALIAAASTYAGRR